MSMGITNMKKTKDGRVLTFTLCENRYWEFVMNLRNDDRVSSGFIVNEKITWENQVNYMSKFSNQFRICLIDESVPIGYIGVIDDDIRVCTHPDYFGMGVGKFMVEECMKIWPSAYAKIKHGNLPSLNLFRSCGFIQSRIDENFVYYTYANNQKEM